MSEKKQRVITNITEYFRGAWSELKKVTWPSKEQTLRDSAVVIAITLIVAIYLGSLDFGFQSLLKWAISFSV